MDEEEGVNIIVSSSSEQRKKNTHTRERVHGDFAQLAPVEESSPSARPP